MAKENEEKARRILSDMLQHHKMTERQAWAIKIAIRELQISIENQ